MPFPQSVKDQAKGQAAFRCCRCGEIGVEVHHIVPQSEGGANTIDNAAPLCPNCHTSFGGNAEKRGEIRAMRDRWYLTAQEKWPTENPESARLNDLLLDVQRENAEAIDELRQELARLAQEAKQAAPGRLGEIANQTIQATRLGPSVYANVKCYRCGAQVGLLSGSDACPECGNPIR